MQVFCFPFDIFQKHILYKVYSFSGVQFNPEDENSLYNEEFNVQRLVTMKTQINDALKTNFEILIELLYSTSHIAYQVNGTIKSLAKLAFHFLIKNKYRKVEQILTDLLKEIVREDAFDSVFYLRMKLLKDQITRKIQL